MSLQAQFFAADPGSKAGSVRTATSPSHFPPRVASVFRFAAPHWRAACRFLCLRLPSASPRPGRRALAPDLPATVMPARSLRRAASRCIVKPPAKSLAPALTGCWPCSRSPCSVPLDTFATKSNQTPARLRSGPRKIIDTVQATLENPGTAFSRQTAPANSPFALRRKSAQKVNLLAQFGGKTPFPGFPKSLGPYQLFSAGPSVSAPVFDLTLWQRYQAARNTANASEANSLSTREQVILLAVSQYIGTLRAVANVQASRSRVDLAQALYDQAADLQKEGVGTGIDTLRANVELQNEKQRLLEAENERETSLYGLSRLLNLDPRQQIELADSLSFFDTPQPDVEARINEGLTARQEWKALQEQIRSAENQKKAATALRLPSLHFSGNWAELGTTPSSVIPTYTYQGSVNVPLFTGGRIRAQVVSADLEIRKLEEQRADLRNQIALDVKTALLNLDSARS